MVPFLLALTSAAVAMAADEPIDPHLVRYQQMDRAHQRVIDAIASRLWEEDRERAENYAHEDGVPEEVIEAYPWSLPVSYRDEAIIEAMKFYDQLVAHWLGQDPVDFLIERGYSIFEVGRWGDHVVLEVVYGLDPSYEIIGYPDPLSKLLDEKGALDTEGLYYETPTFISMGCIDPTTGELEIYEWDGD